MLKRRTKTEQLESAEAARIKAEETTRVELERRDSVEVARVSTERRDAVEEARISADVALLKQRGKPPRIRRHESKRRYGRSQQSQSATNCKGGKTGKLVQSVRK